MGQIKRFEEIEAWKEACILANRIYELSDTGSFSKDFGLRDQMRRAVVLDGNQRRDRSERMTGRDVERQRRVAERQLHAVGGHHVAPGLRSVAAIEQIPVRGRQDDLRAEAILKRLRPSRVIAVAV